MEEFIKLLTDSPISNYPKIIKRLKVDFEDIKKLSSWRPGCYTRNCLARTDKFELILICWEEQSQTAIHGHDGQKCWVYQVEGSVTEIRYDQNQEGELIESSRLSLSPGKLSYMDDKMGFHVLENTSSEKSMTLHLYANPIKSCAVFNHEKKAFESKTLVYDSAPNT